tara:strand:- start:194 stop:1243 length:1050 start_codon:yes stop_codon:yes gene_type:complete
MYENNKYINAAVLTKQRKKLSLLNLAPEKNLQKGQLLVKLYSTSICGAQIGELLGKTGKDKWIPHCLGHEGYGKIIKKHRSVNKVRVNDDVIMHWRKSKGTNSKPTSYLSKNGVINAGLLTTFQTYAVVSENRLTKVNRFKKYTKIAPLLGCAFPTAWGILNKETNYTKNSQILIFGAGGIGLSLASIAKIQKFKRVILVDKSDYKKNITKKMDLEYLNIKNLKKIKKKKFDLVIDTTGNTKNIEKGFDFVNKDGKLILVGQPKLNSLIRIKNPLRLFNPPQDNIKIISSDGGGFNPETDFRKLIILVKKNYSYLSKLITHQIGLNEINYGIDLILKGKTGRVLINFSK